MNSEVGLSENPRGTYILIGGNEDKSRRMDILRVIAGLGHLRKIALVTAASSVPDEVAEMYRYLFLRLGVGEVSQVDVRKGERVGVRQERALHGAVGVVVTGGDQEDLVERTRGTIVEQRINEIVSRGGFYAGTSAGASAVSELMPSGGAIVPGWGLLPRLIVDQHYGERERQARLKTGVIQHSFFVGMGIDEDTAAVWYDGTIRVIGKGRVHVFNALDIRGSINGSLGEGRVYREGDKVAIRRLV